jgi:hypothetical protein
MKNKNILLAIGLLFLISYLFPSQGKVEPLFPYVGGTEPKPGTHSPIITHAYAIDKGRYGTILRIYIEADDPDGDMLRIAIVVDHVGYGHYPTDWIYLKPENRHHLIGYLQWNTFSSKAATIEEWTQVTLKVSIIDKSGNESNVIVFPFTFESGTGPEPKPPAPFDQGDIRMLGHIMIDLRGLDQGDGHERILD